jgi:L,D-peptidoglycan transpeptidase YkuD (ErfK/YbiS/YcfS/YnhG family)
MSVAALAAAGALLCSGPAQAQQLVTVHARAGATVAALELWQRRGTCFRRVAGPWTAELGPAGLSARKREGDGATPTGTYPFGATVYGIAADPGVAFAYHRLVCGDWWDEDPASSTYNAFRHVACGAVPRFRGDSEALWRISPQYRYFAVIEYNAYPVVPGRGSAIFLHVSTGHPTAGCVSLPEGELLRVLRWLRPQAKPAIVMQLT